MKFRIFTAYLFLMTILIFNGCSNSGTGTNNTPPTLDAVISHSPQSPETGEQVTLDASNSVDDQNIGYDVDWSFTNKPSNSTAPIQSSTQMMTSFTPDVAGDYGISLEISNSSESISDNDQITISVTAAASQGPKELSGSINQDSTLTDIFTDPAEPDYLVVGDVDVSAQLTIDPNVVIHFQENTGLTINGDGILVADGEANGKIVFTGEHQTVNGFWRGININSNSVVNSISHAEIRYGGSESAGTYFEPANLTIDQAKVQLSNVAISNSGHYGIQTRRNGSEFPMQSIQFENNDDMHAYVHISQIGYFDSQSTFDGGYVTAFGGSTTGDMVISALNGAKYQIVDNVDFANTITIDAGANFEFGPDAGIKIQSSAIVKAEGTTANKIIFTGVSKTPGAWRGIFVGSSSVENIFKHVDISYGGSTNMATYFDKTNMVIDQAKIILDHVSFTGSAGYGIQTRRNGSEFSVINSEFNNNANSHMLIHATQIDFIDNQTNFNGGDVEVYRSDTEASGSETWSNLNNGTFYFAGSVTIEKEVTIEQGALFEMGTDVKIIVATNTGPGIIKALGSSTEPIVFTGRSKVKGAWGGIIVMTGSVENVMDYVEIEYGGGTDLDIYMAAGNLGVHSDSYLSISNSTIENSANYGLIVRESRNAIINISNVTYANNDNTDYYTY